MEAARLQDEAIQDAGARTLALASGETEFFPWRPAGPPNDTRQAPFPGAEAPTSLETLAGPPAPPAAMERPAGTTWMRRTQAGGLPNRANAPAACTDRTRIEEILICTAQGEVLYGWHCPSSDLWVNFLEFVSQKARRLSQGFTLGSFDQLEASGADAHLIALVSTHQGILVRSRNEPEPANRETRPQPEVRDAGSGPGATA